MTKLIVGLGNPGSAYARNRHNVGFCCVDRFARQCELRFDRVGGRSRLAEGAVGDVAVALAKPRTFVNRSGAAVAALLRRYRLTPADLLVVCDDMDLPLGRLRLRPGGSAGGHNGLKSIIEALGSDAFSRLRVGIDRPTNRDEAAIVAYVLSDFAPSEAAIIADAIERAAAALLCYVTDGRDVAMSRFNQ